MGKLQIELYAASLKPVETIAQNYLHFILRSLADAYPGILIKRLISFHYIVC